MYNPKENIMWFPEPIPTAVLGGKEHNYNCVNGGIIKVEKLGLDGKRFWGGNVQLLGLVKEYGFYACPYGANRNGKIAGFYAYDPDQITEKGKKLFEEWAESVHPGVTVRYVTESPVVRVDNIDVKKVLIDKLTASGGDRRQYEALGLDELRALIEVREGEKIPEDKRIKTEVTKGTNAKASTSRGKVKMGEPKKVDVELSV